MSNNAKTYSFKSVGQLQNDFIQQSLDTLKTIPIGLKTPLTLSNSSGNLFDMTYNVADQIRDNLKNLILTNSGERLMLSDFGANLRPLATEFSNEDIVTEAIRRIQKTTSKYMPYVELDTFENSILPTKNGNTIGVSIKVGYSVPSAGIINQLVEAIIYVVG